MVATKVSIPLLKFQCQHMLTFNIKVSIVLHYFIEVNVERTNPTLGKWIASTPLYSFTDLKSLGMVFGEGIIKIFLNCLSILTILYRKIESLLTLLCLDQIVFHGLKKEESTKLVNLQLVFMLNTHTVN